MSFIERFFVLCPECGEFTVRGSTVLAVCVGSLKHMSFIERFFVLCPEYGEFTVRGSTGYRHRP